MTKQVYECSMKFVISEALSALCIVQPIIYIIKSWIDEHTATGWGGGRPTGTRGGVWEHACAVPLTRTSSTITGREGIVNPNSCWYLQMNISIDWHILCI